jgi:hypothetical protein
MRVQGKRQVQMRRRRGKAGMRGWYSRASLVLVLLALVWPAAASAGGVPGAAAGEGVAASVGPGEGRIVPGERSSTTSQYVLSHHDGTFENGYAWMYGGVTQDGAGSWAEAFSGTYLLGDATFYLTDTGYYMGQSMDVYVWEDAGGEPGNVLFVLTGFVPGQPAFWPDVSAHVAPIGIPVSGVWWVGYWPNWPGQVLGWFQAADENGCGGVPRTNIAPGLGYPSGWQHPNVIFPNAKALGIEAGVDAPAQVPDAALSTVQPWDSYGHAFVSPGTQSGVDEVTVEVRDAYGDPVVGACVEIDLSACEDFCMDVPNGLIGVTDASGQVVLDPRIGGCTECQLTVTANGMPFASYPRIVSTDYDRSGSVDSSDVAALEAFLQEGDYLQCLDYDGNGLLDQQDEQILLTAFSGGDANRLSCSGSQVELFGNQHWVLGDAALGMLDSETLVMTGFDENANDGVLIGAWASESVNLSFLAQGYEGSSARVRIMTRALDVEPIPACCDRSSPFIPSLGCEIVWLYRPGFTEPPCALDRIRVGYKCLNGPFFYGCYDQEFDPSAGSYFSASVATNLPPLPPGVVEWDPPGDVALVRLDVLLDGQVVGSVETVDTSLVIDPILPVDFSADATTMSLGWAEPLQFTLPGRGVVEGDELRITPVDPFDPTWLLGFVAIAASGLDSLLLVGEDFVPTSSSDVPEEDAGREDGRLALSLLGNPVPGGRGGRILLRLPEPDEVTLDLVDPAGRRVARILEGTLEAGEHQLDWRRGSNGTPSLVSGVYFLKLTTGRGELVRKMVVLE